MKKKILSRLTVLLAALLLAMMAVPPAVQTATVPYSTPVIEYCFAPGPSHLLVFFGFSNSGALSTYLYNAYYNPESSSYHKFLTPLQFDSLYSPPAWVTSDTRAIFTDYGVKVIEKGPMLMEGSASTYAQVDEAIGALAASPVYSYLIGAECMPQAYDGVPGSNVPSYTPTLQKVPLTSAALSPAVSSTGCVPDESIPGGLIWSPCGLQTIYDENALIDHGSAGNGLTIAVVDAYGDPNPALATASNQYQYGNLACSDYKAFNFYFDLPMATCNVVYPTGLPQLGPYNVNDALGWATETGIDTQYSHVMAPGAHILEVTASTDYDDLYAAVEYIVNSHAANMISLSFGEWEDLFYCTSGTYGCSPPNTAGLMLGYNEIFQQAAAEGIGVFVSTGDYAAFDPYYGTISASAPATDPWVTAVGGTTLNATFSPTTVTRNESAWSYGFDSFNRNIGTGGGFSMVFSTPTSQLDLTNPTQGVVSIHDKIIGSSGYNFDPEGQRGVPDVSADADPATGVLVMTDGSFGVYVWGGTSLAAPLTAGMTATIQSRLPTFTIGTLAPSLYAEYYTNYPGTYVATDTFTPSQLAHGFAGAMFETSVGENGVWTVTPGIWNPVAGLGQPNVYGLYQVFSDAG